MIRNLSPAILSLAILMTMASPASSQCTGGLWSDFTEMRVERSGIGAVHIGNVVYIYGGLQSIGPARPLQTVTVLDLSTGQTVPVQFLPAARHNMASAALFGKPYLIGGFFGELETSNSCWEYDAVDDVWDRIANLPARRADMAAVDYNGQIYVFGGVAANLVPQNQVYAYEPGGDDWTTLTPLSTRRARLAVVEANGFIYVIGGQGVNAPVAVNERYAPDFDEWAPMAPMNHARAGAAAGIVNGKIYVCGGEDDTGVVAHNEVYDISLNTWSCRADMTTPRHSMVSIALDEEILFFGGSTASVFAATAIIDQFTAPEFVATPKQTMSSFKALFGGARSPN